MKRKTKRNNKKKRNNNKERVLQLICSPRYVKRWHEIQANKMKKEKKKET